MVEGVGNVINQPVGKYAFIEEFDDIDADVVGGLRDVGVLTQVKTVFFSKQDIIILLQFGRGDENENIGEQPVVDGAEVLIDLLAPVFEKSAFQGEKNVGRIQFNAPSLELLAQEMLISDDFGLERSCLFEGVEERSIGFKFIADDKQVFLHAVILEMPDGWKREFFSLTG
jgi:hypothetical protein